MKLVPAVLATMLLIPSAAYAAEGETGVPTYVVDFLQPIILSVVGALGAWLLAVLSRAAQTYITHAQSKAAVERALQAVAQAVGEVTQTFVEGAKKRSEDGTLSKDDCAQALQEALANARSYLGPRGIALLRWVLGSDENALDRWLVGAIEAQIASTKPWKK